MGAIEQVEQMEPAQDHDHNARFERMERVTVLYGQITAATREFLRALAESDRHGDWAEEGFSSCADWLAWQIGVTRGTAREKVRAARALESLPLISEAMSRGEVSFSKVRALTRVASPESEAELLEFARSGSTASLERLVRSWKTMSRDGELRTERLRHGTRRFSVYPDGEGMYEIRGRIAPEVAAVLMRAIEAAGDALYREVSGTDKGRADEDRPDEDRPEEVRPDPEQRRADALGLLAERALAAGFGDEASPVSGSRAERYQVTLHVEAETLSESGEPGMSELDDGTRVSAETSRRLSCDAGRVVVRKAPNGTILDVGRRTRTIPPALRRALDARDCGCRFPGCGLRFTDAHHIVHWADGGRTDLKNTVLLCRRHHRLVHEEGHRICSDQEGRVVFFTPEGRAIASVGCPPVLDADPVGEMIRDNRHRGAEPEWDTIMPRYHHTAPVPWEIEADAWQALDRAAEGVAPSTSPTAPMASQFMNASFRRGNAGVRGPGEEPRLATIMGGGTDRSGAMTEEVPER